MNWQALPREIRHAFTLSFSCNCESPRRAKNCNNNKNNNDNNSNKMEFHLVGRDICLVRIVVIGVIQVPMTYEYDRVLDLIFLGSRLCRQFPGWSTRWHCFECQQQTNSSAVYKLYLISLLRYTSVISTVSWSN